MNNLKTVKPFRCLCMTIGNLPTAYFESMSYYECLTFLVKFLENEVIPTVNNNSEVVKELQEFVVHYFDNLDVQEEINNKLDEMAESGELTDIIAQYLQLAGILAYNTKNDLKNAENLSDGSFTKTYGENIYNDGKGAFYKIRELLNTDVIDNDNLLALTNYPSLVAEKMKTYENKEKGIIAISRNTTNNDHYLYYSEDGKDFYRVGNKLSLTSDSSALILINDTYYYFGNNEYNYSTDLVNWSDDITINDTNGKYNWAFYPFYDPVNDKYLVFSALQYKDGTFTDSVGNTTYYFKIIKQEFTVNNDKTLTFGASSDVIYVDNESYIDPAVCYDSIHGYTLAVKKEDGVSSSILLYNTSNLNSIGSSYANISGVGSEACQLIDEDGFISLYIHDYALNSQAVTGLSEDLGQTYSRVIVATPLYTFDSNSLCRECCKMPEIYRHAGIMKCNNNTLNLISSIGIKTTPLFICDDYSINDEELKQVTCTTASASYELHNLPYVAYILGGGVDVDQITLTVKKLYNAPLRLLLGPTNVHFTGDTVDHTVTTSANVDGLLATQNAGNSKFINTPYKW